MKIRTYIELLNETSVATIAAPAPAPVSSKSFLSDKQVELNKKHKISIFFKKFQLNLLGVLKEFISANKNLFEGRNDIKLIILASAIFVPKDFKVLKITSENKEKLIKYLISKKSIIKLKKEASFSNHINKAIDIVFKKNILNDLVAGNLRITYNNIINKVKEEVIDFADNLNHSDERSLKTNIEKRIVESLSIKMIAPNTSTEPKVKNGTHYISHPNGVGKFPDFIFYFGTILNDDAKKIMKDFNIKTSKVFVESKASGRIVGKQTSPERFKKDLNDDDLFTKLTSIKIGGSGPEFNGKEMKKMLEVSDIDLSIPVIYLNLLGKTKKTFAKSLNMKIKDNEIFQSKRNSPGQIGFFKDGKKVFGFEIGSVAYKKGLFKEGVKRYAKIQ